MEGICTQTLLKFGLLEHNKFLEFSNQMPHLKKLQISFKIWQNHLVMKIVLLSSEDLMAIYLMVKNSWPNHLKKVIDLTEQTNIVVADLPYKFHIIELNNSVSFINIEIEKLTNNKTCFPIPLGNRSHNLYRNYGLHFNHQSKKIISSILRDIFTLDITISFMVIAYSKKTVLKLYRKTWENIWKIQKAVLQSPLSTQYLQTWTETETWAQG